MSLKLFITRKAHTSHKRTKRLFRKTTFFLVGQPISNPNFRVGESGGTNINSVRRGLDMGEKGREVIALKVTKHTREEERGIIFRGGWRGIIFGGG